jgi:uncharacterized protein YutE (UPF0331/DUF86 family)
LKIPKTRILLKLEQLEKYLATTSDILPSTEEKYLSSIKDQLAIERSLQLSIEIMIDIAILLLKYLHLGTPADEESVFDMLASHLENHETYKNMKRFRNVLVHRYEGIDSSLVYNNVINNLDDFYTYIEEVKKIIKEN